MDHTKQIEINMLAFLFLACSDKPNTESSAEPSSEVSVEPSTEPSTEPEPLLIEEGDWTLGAPTLVSDVCSVGDFQDVTGFVAEDIGIGNSTSTSFLMLPDGLVCSRTDLDFICESFSFDEDTGLAAELSIVNEISGTIIDEETFVLDFDVTIESCEGIGCLLIEAALTFPCLIELQSEGTFAP